MVPSLNARNLETVKIGKDFMVSHGYIKNDFDVDEWARPEFLEQASKQILEEEWERRSWSKSCPLAALRGRSRAARLTRHPVVRRDDRPRRIASGRCASSPTTRIPWLSPRGESNS